MGKKILNKKKFVLLAFGIFVLLVGGIVAYTNLDYKVKIDKVGNKYYVYHLKEDLTKDKILSELGYLKKEKARYLNEIYPKCVQSCSNFCKTEAEYLNTTRNVKECIEECPSDCELEKEYLVGKANERINQLNKYLKSK